MNHYVDLTLLPDPEFAQADLMDMLFTQLHRALVAQRSERIGVSFPALQTESLWLGDVLRLHGAQADLAAMMATPWLGGMRDHLRASPVLAVPVHTRHRVVSRVQAKSSPERQRRRLMRRQNLDAAQAQARIPDSAAERLNLPSVHLRSLSTDQSFRLFIRHGDLQDKAVSGPFGTYALSPQATIPWF